MKIALVLASVALAVAMPAAALAAGAAPAAAKPKASAEPATQAVEYADLGKYIGKRIIVHSKLNTTRAGVLTRVTASEIDVKLDSGADLTMPSNSIKSIGAPIGAPDPLFQPAPDKKPADAKPGDAKAEGKAAPAKATDFAPPAKGAKPADTKPQGKTGDSSAKKN